MIMPNDSFVARLTVPRAGTFIYHTHLNDLEQLTSGLYGAIVVLEPGEKWDPARDHVFVLGWHTPEEPPTLLLNGDSVPPPVTFAPGRHRLRFVNIGPAGAPMFRLLQAGNLVTWTPLAKDGMTLLAHRQQPGRAAQRIAIGETFDAMWEATLGEYVLQIARPAGGGIAQKIVVEKVQTVERVEGQ
jgi:FtsP/CotA-like multicopper oxidase with cupredoxin domain